MEEEETLTLKEEMREREKKEKMEKMEKMVKAVATMKAAKEMGNLAAKAEAMTMMKEREVRVEKKDQEEVRAAHHQVPLATTKIQRQFKFVMKKSTSKKLKVVTYSPR